MSESFTNLLNEGVGQTTYMAAAHSSMIPLGIFRDVKICKHIANDL